MQKSENESKDIFCESSEKKVRGPERRIPGHWVLGTANNYNVQFWSVWDKIGERLLAAESSDEVLQAISSVGTSISESLDRAKLSTLIFQTMNDPSFPKLRRKSQIRFLSDSLGANGALTPRRSRDVCAEERAKAKRTYQIIRYEYFVECSCGYEGHSRDLACANCGAKIPFSTFSGM